MFLFGRKKSRKHTGASKNKLESSVFTPNQEISPSPENKSDIKNTAPVKHGVNTHDFISVTVSETPYPEEKNEFEQIQNLKAVSFPSKQGLYPHEILMLSYAERFKTSNNEFQGFWHYRYAVNNPQDLLSSLESKEFICKGSVSESLQLYKVPELKAILESHNLKKSGTKAILIERLLNELDETDLEKLTTVRPYHLTEKGERELSDNEYITYLTDKHSHWYHSLTSHGINIWTINKRLHDHPNSDYHDLIWKSLNELIPKTLAQVNNYNNWGPYVNIKLVMYQFLLKEGHYSDAYACYLEALFYEISFSAVDTYLSNVNYSNDNNHTTLYIEATSRLGDLFILNQIMNSCGLSYSTFPNFLLRNFQNYVASDTFTPVQIVKFIIAEMTSNTNISKQICSEVEQQLLNSIRGINHL